eukprot:7388396-Prymnesium_polylepis.1
MEACGSPLAERYRRKLVRGIVRTEAWSPTSFRSGMMPGAHNFCKPCSPQSSPSVRRPQSSPSVRTKRVSTTESSGSKQRRHDRASLTTSSKELVLSDVEE